MKLVQDRTVENVKTAWGAYGDISFQKYEITSDDVGVSRPHYLGHDAGAYRFKPSDVGRIIRVDSDVMPTANRYRGAYTCWYFV